MEGSAGYQHPFVPLEEKRGLEPFKDAGHSRHEPHASLIPTLPAQIPESDTRKPEGLGSIWLAGGLQSVFWDPEG